MDLNTYQQKAKRTEQKSVKKQADAAVIVPLLGLSGEAGQLIAEYKKYLRDGDAHRAFPERISEELGDVLWYLSSVASQFDLSLEDIAQNNIKKCSKRWNQTDSSYFLFDEDFPEAEQFERSMIVELVEVEEDNKIKTKAFINKKKVGDDLTDNAYRDDGYRFHDVLHLAYVAVLGWSPVIRGLLGKKRKSNPSEDEVQDGGRAVAIEEGITALIFTIAERHEFFKNVSSLDFSLLKTVDGMVSKLEVGQRSFNDWQRAILSGYEVWRQVKERKHATIELNLIKRTIELKGDASEEIQRLALEPSKKRSKSAPKRR